MLTLLEISDAPGKPQAKIDLPQLSLGSRVRLRFRLERKNGGRHEVLVVDGQFRVMAVGLDAGVMPQRQVVSVESVTVAPMWKAVKKTTPWKRALPATRAPRKVIEG